MNWWYAVRFDGIEVFCDEDHFTYPSLDNQSFIDYVREALAFVDVMNAIEKEME